MKKFLHILVAPLIVLLIGLAITLGGCSQKKRLKVAATAVPHAQMLECIAPQLKKEGIDLEIIVVDDYQLPNRLLAEGQIDANFFQHLPFLQEQQRACGYRFVVLSEIHVEPLCLYSSRHVGIDFASFRKVAIPSDPTNEKRALLLLEDLALITLKGQKNSLLDIDENPYKLCLTEIDAAMLVRILPDVDYAIIPGNYILQSGLDLDPLLTEVKGCTLYPNVLVAREGDEKREDLKLLTQSLKSADVKKQMEEKFKNCIKFFN